MSNLRSFDSLQQSVTEQGTPIILWTWQETSPGSGIYQLVPIQPGGSGPGDSEFVITSSPGGEDAVNLVVDSQTADGESDSWDSSYGTYHFLLAGTSGTVTADGTLEGSNDADAPDAAWVPIGTFSLTATGAGAGVFVMQDYVNIDTWWAFARLGPDTELTGTGAALTVKRAR